MPKLVASTISPSAGNVDRSFRNRVQTPFRYYRRDLLQIIAGDDWDALQLCREGSPAHFRRQYPQAEPASGEPASARDTPELRRRAQSNRRIFCPREETVPDAPAS